MGSLNVSIDALIAKISADKLRSVKNKWNTIQFLYDGKNFDKCIKIFFRFLWTIKTRTIKKMCSMEISIVTYKIYTLLLTEKWKFHVADKWLKILMSKKRIEYKECIKKSKRL